LFSKWDKFFIDHLEEYYEWAKNDPISDAEELRNIKLNLYCGIPNIFVGRISNAHGYHKSDFQIIDELLFSKPHNHTKYTNMDFLFDLPDLEKPDEVRAVVKTKIEKYSRSHCIMPDPTASPVGSIESPTPTPPVVILHSTAPPVEQKVRSPVPKKPKTPPVATGGFRRSIYKFGL
jgi:hypothetical protein